MSRRARRRRDARPGPSGFLVVDKPPGWTSHDAVEAARGWLGTRRVGHLGTLDPIATGVLPMAVRGATKLVPFVSQMSKSYRGTVRLGVETDTLDADGEELRRCEGELPSEEQVRGALASFRGEIEQVPPMFSAVKRAGVPLYRLARQGLEVAREPRKVRVERFELLHYAAPDAEIEVTCSPGTYVRVLASDLGRRLGCGAHLHSLRRTRNGPFRDEQGAPPGTLEAEARAGVIDRRLVAPADVLGLPLAHLGPEEVGRVAHGGNLPAGRHALGERPGTRFAAVDPRGELVAVMELRADRRLVPLRVLRVAASGA